jgi:hypothetical protein
LRARPRRAFLNAGTALLSPAQLARAVEQRDWAGQCFLDSVRHALAERSLGDVLRGIDRSATGPFRFLPPSLVERVIIRIERLRRRELP